MSRVDTAMSRWLVYAQTHGLLSLDLRVFPPILERLRAYLQVWKLCFFSKLIFSIYSNYPNMTKLKILTVR